MSGDGGAGDIERVLLDMRRKLSALSFLLLLSSAVPVVLAMMLQLGLWVRVALSGVVAALLAISAVLHGSSSRIALATYALIRGDSETAAKILYSVSKTLAFLAPSSSARLRDAAELLEKREKLRKSVSR